MMLKYSLLSLASLGLGWLCLPLACQSLEVLFGPDAITLREAYSRRPQGATFDHQLFDEVLKSCVHEGGWIDYESLKTSPEKLDRYLSSLETVDFEALSRDEKLALLINAYNAFTLRLILDHLPLDSIRDIPGSDRWDAERWKIGGMKLSLLSLENEFLRSRFREPRIHFAINCASVGCPPLRNEAYRGAQIESQLQHQASLVHQQGRWFQLDPEARRLELTRLYLWYGSDFTQIEKSVLDYAAGHSPALAGLAATGPRVALSWLNYDWSLNHIDSPARR